MANASATPNHELCALPKATNDITFFSRTIPDIPKRAFIVGLCSVPISRAQPDDLGWHITDFLAWKTLFRGRGSPNSQAWFAACDIAQLVKARPEDYTHGPEKTVVRRALRPSFDNIPGVGLRARDDYKYPDSTDSLTERFLSTVSQFSLKASKAGMPLVIFLCGPANLNQDIYLGDAEHQAWIRSNDIRNAMLDSHIISVVVTPSPFSPGWQINPCFSAELSLKTRAAADVFLAMQFGGLVSRELLKSCLGDDGPWLNRVMLDMDTAPIVSALGPIEANIEQVEAARAVVRKLSQTLSGRSLGPGDHHAFSFETDDDDWEKYIGPRQGPLLSELKMKWDRLPKLIRQGSLPLEGLSLLGNAFGGLVSSQTEHMRLLVDETVLALKKAAAAPSSDGVLKCELDYFFSHDGEESTLSELFYFLEHRATSAVLGDVLLKRLGLYEWAPAPGRYHEWNPVAWKASRNLTLQSAETKLAMALDAILVFPSEYRLPKTLFQEFKRAEHHPPIYCQYIAAAVTASGRCPDSVITEIHKVLEGVFKEQTARLDRALGDRGSCVLWPDSKRYLRSADVGSLAHGADTKERIEVIRPRDSDSCSQRASQTFSTVIASRSSGNGLASSGAENLQLQHLQTSTLPAEHSSPQPVSNQSQATDLLISSQECWARIAQLQRELRSVLDDDDAAKAKWVELVDAVNAALSPDQQFTLPDPRGEVQRQT
ncbi:uncharacterized protein B0I36DRAFT_65139 [Microdochium trichocladiopsis]|uniref:Uncharacterized protein n=1 Tax=Microdochium trichocladiopsis TaxID=1682393 RepID=A0A9P8YE74_9PEZI|nr:uncharacterized protein B0I36DRAFT_65139 [Microdochium trichocladiopsis]KAH7037371.1 hypothetical protein B0I36DRAFT_65139 [Microdochium trichocladiopsis]